MKDNNLKATVPTGFHFTCPIHITTVPAVKFETNADNFFDIEEMYPEEMFGLVIY